MDRVVNKLLHCVIKNVNTVAKEAGPAEAAKLVDTILRQAHEISCQPADEEGLQAMKPAATSQRVLRMLFWETTVRCNLACAHCRRLESNEAGVRRTCPPRRREALIEQLAELGRTRQPQMPVLVFSGGEPLCRGDLFHLVDRARQQGIISPGHEWND